MEIIKPGTNFDFVGKIKITTGISIALIIISILSVVMHKGLNLGIEFAGGTIIQIKFSQTAGADDIRKTFMDINISDAIIQEIGKDEVIVRTNHPADKEFQTIVDEAMVKQFGEGNFEIRKIEFVGPKVGADLRNKAVLAIILSCLGMLIYIAFRFEFRYGLGGVIALIHDTIVTIGALSLLNKEFTLAVVAALLTIIGYSINDTIVVFDRIRENRRKDLRKKLADVINSSINETLSRTILTSLTVVLVLVALFFLGGPVIHDFSFALLVGVIVGTYSSIFIASPIVLFFESSKLSRGKGKK
ncbi:MAG TPA: protein translocase subunit SecF [Smithellaceae bacterium]|jgi:preprotein translocase subunit SecF|nr:protein translocase subunit SecF [Smithellaceae bacterium]HQG79614.1 protein translocase subunit SecF [Smithellaceae bacterium]